MEEKRERKKRNNGCLPSKELQKEKTECKVCTLHNAHYLKTEKWRYQNKCRVWRAHSIESNTVKYYVT